MGGVEEAAGCFCLMDLVAELALAGLIGLVSDDPVVCFAPITGSPSRTSNSVRVSSLICSTAAASKKRSLQPSATAD